MIYRYENKDVIAQLMGLSTKKCCSLKYDKQEECHLLFQLVFKV